MSALSEVLDPYRLRIALDADAFSDALVSYTAAQAAGTVTDGPFLSSRMRATLRRLADDIAAARRKVRSLPRDTPGRSQAHAALGTLARGYTDLKGSLEVLGTQEGIDAAAAPAQATGRRTRTAPAGRCGERHLPRRDLRVCRSDRAVLLRGDVLLRLRVLHLQRLPLLRHVLIGV